MCVACAAAEAERALAENGDLRDRVTELEAFVQRFLDNHILSYGEKRAKYERYWSTDDFVQAAASLLDVEL